MQTGSVIELRGTVDWGEPARIDRLNVTLEELADPTDPFLCIEIEAEDMQLSDGYRVRRAADGEKYIEAEAAWKQWCRDDDVSGMATTHFAGPEGVYTLDVNLFDEIDGASEIPVNVDGVYVVTLVLVGSDGGNIFHGSARTLRIQGQFGRATCRAGVWS